MYKNFMHANAAYHLKCNLIPKQEKLIKSINGYKVSINYLQEAMLNETNETHVKYLDYMIAAVSEKIQSLKDDLRDVIADIKLYKQYSKAAQRNYDKNPWPKIGDTFTYVYEGTSCLATIDEIRSLELDNNPNGIKIGFTIAYTHRKNKYFGKKITETRYGLIGLKDFNKLYNK